MLPSNASSLLCLPAGGAAWRGDAPLLKVLLDAGARLDVEGVSRGVGPFGPLQWAERKVSQVRLMLRPQALVHPLLAGLRTHTHVHAH